MTNLHFVRRLLAAALVAVAITACIQEKARLVADPTSQRSTPLGDVVGGVGEYGNHVWLGLPFAKPPLGELR